MDTFDRLLTPGRLLCGALVDDLLRDHFGMAELEIGQNVGAFRIERELGRGGMGIVYLASRADGAYEQQVAIKWSPGSRPLAAQAERFRRERQIHAHLRHPNIARLLDGGRGDDGHLWFALEHVEGPPVDRHAAEAGMDWPARVRLLLPVIEAVQFAHGRLLVHRDIKPDNVLMDSDGRPKLIDFGVAGLLADETVADAFTPGFASPEQVAGAPADIASDVWQLGTLLHHVLAADTPRHPAPVCPRDLRAIIAKATASAPEQRYATAAALRADLRRLLRYRPVSARPPSLPHRLHLLVRAHPWGVSASVLATLAFAVTVIVFMLGLTRERDAARHAQTVAEAVNAFLDQDFLPGIDPLQGGASDVSVAELSERALDKLEARLQDLPEVAGQVGMSLGRTLANLGRFEAASRAFVLAAAYFSTAYGMADERTLRARLAQEHVDINQHSMTTADQRLKVLRADVLKSLGPTAGLLAEVDSQLARAAFLRDDFAVCESRYRALLPRLDGGDQVVLAQAHGGLSLCQSRLGHWDQALLHARQARLLDERALGRDHPITLETHVAVGAALVGLGRYGEAIEVYRDLVPRLEYRYGHLHPSTLTAIHDLGVASTCAGQLKDAVHWLRRAADGRARAHGRDHPWYAMTESVLAMALIRGRQWDEAADALMRARRALGEQAAETPYIQLTLLENQADLALGQGRADAAIEGFERSLALAPSIYPPDHPRVLMLQLGHGLALVVGGDVAGGERRMRESLRLIGERPDCRANRIASARQLLRD